MNKQRQEAERLVYETMDALDPTHSNSDYYKTIFADMNDEQFLKFIKRDLPFKFQVRPFEIEPNMNACNKAAKVLGVPLLEPVSLEYIYKDDKGRPLKSHPCLVGYIPIKKMKQFITKKNSMSVDISERDMKTGLLVNFDKNGKTSDREMEALAVMGLEETMRELSRPRADAMESKSSMYAEINATGMVALDELPMNEDDSLAKNLINVYLLGSLVNTNLVNKDYLLPKTLKDKQRAVEREH